MNPLKSWNAKLEVGIFLAIKKPVQAVCNAYNWSQRYFEIAFQQYNLIIN